MKWILTYSLACSGAIGAVLVLAWIFGGFDTEGVSTHGIIAIVLGTMFAVLVAVGLMALIFYSNRSGQDDQQ
jgi:preprotein translocase subunit SecF